MYRTWVSTLIITLLPTFNPTNSVQIFMFDVSNPAKPVYKHGLTSSSGACMDEFVAHKNGGFAVSSMCGACVTSAASWRLVCVRARRAYHSNLPCVSSGLLAASFRTSSTVVCCACLPVTATPGSPVHMLS